MTLTAPRATAPQTRPTKPRPAWGAWGLFALAVVLTIVAGWAINFDLRPLFTDSGRGWFIVREFLVPNWGFLDRTVAPLVDTVAIAVIASIIGCILALFISMLTSMVTVRNRYVYAAAKGIMSVVRSLPDIAWGLLFVAFVGIGGLAGILALIMFNIGIIAKLTAETIDAVDPGPIEAADAAGANGMQRAFVAVVPQILPNYLSYCLYVFELNVRASVVLGMVGAGGIGSTLMVELARFNYANVSAIIVVIFVIVFIIDQASRVVRRRLIG